jgi:hypothetical protein
MTEAQRKGAGRPGLCELLWAWFEAALSPKLIYRLPDRMPDRADMSNELTGAGAKPGRADCVHRGGEPYGPRLSTQVINLLTESDIFL